MDDGDIEFLRFGLLYQQVCVPETWDEEKVLDEANRQRPSGTSNGWVKIATQADFDEVGSSDRARVTCDEHPGKVHVVLVC